MRLFQGAALATLKWLTKALCHHLPPSNAYFAVKRCQSAAILVPCRGGIPVVLTRKEFLLRWLLASRHGEILPRLLLASETNIVDVAIRRLRRKIDGLFAKKLIKRQGILSDGTEARRCIALPSLCGSISIARSISARIFSASGHSMSKTSVLSIWALLCRILRQRR